MTVALTRRELQLFDFIGAYIGEHGFSPSYDEMLVEMNLKSKSNIHRMVKQLVSRGAIGVLPNRARSIWILSGYSIDIPRELHSEVQEIARFLDITPEALVAHCLREYLASSKLQRAIPNTSDATNVSGSARTSDTTKANPLTATQAGTRAA